MAHETEWRVTCDRCGTGAATTSRAYWIHDRGTGCVYPPSWVPVRYGSLTVPLLCDECRRDLEEFFEHVPK